MISCILKNAETVTILIARTGMSLRSFSNKVGISQSYLSQILKGNYNPSSVVAYKIANGLGKEIEDIFTISVTDKVSRKVVS